MIKWTFVMSWIDASAKFLTKNVSEEDTWTNRHYIARADFRLKDIWSSDMSLIIESKPFVDFSLSFRFDICRVCCFKVSQLKWRLNFQNCKLLEWIPTDSTLHHKYKTALIFPLKYFKMAWQLFCSWEILEEGTSVNNCRYLSCWYVIFVNFVKNTVAFLFQNYWQIHLFNSGTISLSKSLINLSAIPPLFFSLRSLSSRASAMTWWGHR